MNTTVTHPQIAPAQPRFDDVRRIAVLRGGGLGDVLFALPAMRALAAAYPGSTVTLLGRPMHEQLFAGRPGAPHEVAVLPNMRALGSATDDRAQTERFVADMRDRSFDLAVQVHGGGRTSNPFLLALGARHTVGTRTPDAEPLERTLHYAYYQHEVLRALEVAGLAGALPVELEPSVPVLDSDLDAADRALGRTGSRPLVALHAGATDPRRRWPASSFADAAARALADGAHVVLVGDPGDVGLCDGIAAESAERVRAPEADRLTNLAGRLDLPALIGVLARADVLIANDSGPRHLAQAVGTPTVSVYWFGNLINAGPLGRGNHRVHLGWVTHCPVCGRDCTQVGWTAERCEHDVSFVADVTVGAVYDDVAALIDQSGDADRDPVTARTAPPRGR